MSRKKPTSVPEGSSSSTRTDVNQVPSTLELHDHVGDEVEVGLAKIRRELDETMANQNALRSSTGHRGASGVYNQPTQYSQSTPSPTRALLQKKGILPVDERLLTITSPEDGANLLADTVTVSSNDRKHPEKTPESQTSQTIKYCHARKLVNNVSEVGDSGLYESPKRVDIDGRAVPVMTLENGLDVTVNWDPILPREDLADPLFKLMIKTSMNDLKVRERTEMLYALVKDGRDLSFWFHESVSRLDTFKALNVILKKTYSSRHSTKQYALGLKLYSLYKILKASDTLKQKRGLRKNTASEHEEIRMFRAWVERLQLKQTQDAVKSAGNKKSRKKNSKERFQQPGGSSIYFPICKKVIEKNPAWMHQRKNDPCPNCGHLMLVIVNDPDSVRHQNEIKKAEWELATLEWQENGADPAKKPKLPKGSIEQMLVCMCCVSSCKDPFTGNGCIVCEEYVQNSPDNRVPFDQQWAKCICEVCKCKCSVYFARSKWQAVETAAFVKKEEEAVKKAKEANERSTKQSTLDTLFSVTKKATDQNGLASMGHGILTNAEINKDTHLRANLQMALPSPTRLVKKPT